MYRVSVNDEVRGNVYRENGVWNFEAAPVAGVENLTGRKATMADVLTRTGQKGTFRGAVRKLVWNTNQVKRILAK